MWVELHHSHFNLKNVLWAELPASHFSKLCSPKMSDKNDFQMELLFSNQLSDYGANVHIILSDHVTPASLQTLLAWSDLASLVRPC